jgi:exfoliative toxin A/B
MLGFAGLGNLLQSYGEPLHVACGAISALLGVLLIAHLISDSGSLRRDMANPLLASISGTFPMALTLLAGYVRPLSVAFGAALWWIGFALHICLIVWFTATYVARFDLKKVFPSWYIVYVGIVAASLCAPSFGQQLIGAICFWFGLICFVPLTVVIVARYTKVGEPPAPARPVFCIMTAPASLCVAGYVQSVSPASAALLVVLEAVATIFYVVVLVRLPSLLSRKDFSPAYAAYTFPFAITAIALKQTMGLLAKLGYSVPWLGPIVVIETVIATVLALYALVRFLMHIFARKPRQ